MYKLSEQPQNTAKLLGSTLKFWETYYFKLLGLVIFTILLGIVPGFFIPDLTVFSHEHVVAFVVTHWLWILGYSLIMFFLFSVIVHQVYSSMYEKNYTIKNSLIVTLKKMPYLMIALFIYDLSVFAGLAVFLIPGIGIIVLLSMYFILIIVEDETPISAYKKSWLMVTENWWHTFTIILILTALIFLVSAILDYLILDLFGVIHLFAANGLSGVRRILKIAADLITLPFYISGLMMLYHDLKLRQQLIPVNDTNQ